MPTPSALVARYHSRKGDHAKALARCRYSDIPVLSRAGMHLSVLAAGTPPSRYLIEALLHAGKPDATVELLTSSTVARRGVPGRVWGRLAAITPEKTLELIDRDEFPDIARFCELITTGSCGATPRARPGDHLLGALKALLSSDTGNARDQLGRLYSRHGLETPTFRLEDGKLDFSAARCSVETACSAKQPKISVVITALNEERHLPTAIDSILLQTWANMELVVVDDCSSDGTYRIARDYAARDRRVRAISLPRTIGTWRAKNVGLAACSGTFVTMHDADDWSHPRKLQFQAEPLIDDPGLACTSSYFFRVGESTGLPYTRNADSLLRWNPSSLMYRRSALDDIGDYFVDLLGGDCEFAARFETRWGNRKHRRIRLPLAIGWHRARSLSTRHREHGGNQTDGRMRLQHWEIWRRFHAQAVARPKSIFVRNQGIERLRVATNPVGYA